MDRKSILILVGSFVLLMLWYPLMEKIYPPKPLPRTTNSVAAASNQLSPATTVSNTGSTTTPARIDQTARTNAPEVTLTMTNVQAVYTFTSHGGGLKLVELRDYPLLVECDRTAAATNNRFATLNNRALVPAFSMGGGEPPDGDGIYQLSRTETGVRAVKQMPNGLQITKDFSPGSNHLFVAKIRIENTSAQPVALLRQEWVVGTATAMGENDTLQMLGTFWNNGVKSEQIADGWFANRALGCLWSTPRALFESDPGKAAWAAVHNQFFTLAVIPAKPASQMVARRVVVPMGDLTNTAHAFVLTNGYQASLAYPPTVLAPKQSVEESFTVYAGPKEYKTLSRLGYQFNNNIDAVMNFGFFGFFAKSLLLVMNGLASFGMTYGWAIVTITVVIKLVFWPLTMASTRSMKRMQTLQPQMNAIKEKYKDDAVKMNQKTMEFMRENKVNPLGGCLPMMLQIPVFIGFYTMIQSAIELRGQSFLWACDLSQPDTIFHVAGFPLNPLPLIYGATLLWSANLTPAAPGMDPAQQKIMKYMPVMFLVILYNMASGLTLYWTVQNLLTITQMKLTKTNDGKTPPAGKPSSPAAPVVPGKKKRPA